MAEIRTKAEFYRLWRAGLLGNKPRMWDNPTAALRADPPATQFGIRQVGRAGGGRFCVVPRASLMGEIATWAGLTYVIDDGAPNHLSVLQGEVCRTARGLEGVLGVRTGLNMREAAARGLLRPVRGLQVRLLMEKFLDPASLDDIRGLLDLYPDATIEFCAYSVNVGDIRGRNTIIWEVRNY